MDDPVNAERAPGIVPAPVVPPDDVLRALLAGARTIAVVGLSAKPGRPALDIAAFLQGRGYRIVPVHPRENEVLGERVYPSLRDIPDDAAIDIVDVFRRAGETPEVADDAVAIGASAFWLQQDIVNEEAGRIAADGGLTVIMGICIRQTILRLDAAVPDRERGDPI
ncbi:MAG TPA: CoA-binding protein [Actinomycetota bacterium]